MPYYPLNRIIPNQYTSGGEYSITATGEEYVGYYFKTFTGEAYTGKTPQDTPNKRLTPKVDSDDTELPAGVNIGFYGRDAKYYNFSKKVKNKRPVILPNELPQQRIPIITEMDYYMGEFIRYFCRKRNEPIFIEVLQEDYDFYKKNTNKTAYILYKPFKLTWKLTGEPVEVATVNKNIVEYSEQKFKVLGFSQFIQDYTKFYKDLSGEN